tara:strand:- start:975 stop:1976 length:1002 start_codon:yes stop_codon:yes gene_type:complete
MIEIKNKNIFLDDKILKSLPKSGMIYVFDNNIKIKELFKIFSSSRNIDLKSGHNFINFESLLKLLFSEKKKIFSLIKLIQRILYIEYKFSEKDIKQIADISDVNIDKLKNELFCNFSDGQKIKVILLILKYFQNQIIFIDYLFLKKIDFSSRKLILAKLVDNNKLFTSHSKDSELMFKNIFFLINTDNKLKLLELKKNNNLQYFKYLNNFNKNSSLLENIEYKFKGSKIYISINFKKKKFYALRYYIALTSNDLVLCGLHSELIKNQKKQIKHNFSIDLKDINKFVGNIHLKITFFRNRFLKTKNIIRHDLLFLHISKFKNNTSHYHDKIFLN